MSSGVQWRRTLTFPLPSFLLARTWERRGTKEERKGGQKRKGGEERRTKEERRRGKEEDKRGGVRRGSRQVTTDIWELFIF